MDQKGFNQFLAKIRAKCQNETDMDEFRSWLTSLPRSQALEALNRYEESYRVSGGESMSIDVEKMAAAIEMALDSSKTVNMRKRSRLHITLKIAASLLLITSVCIYYYPKVKSSQGGGKDQAERIDPGKDRAILKLANGQVIDLDTAGDGLVTLNRLSTGFKKQKGLLSYQPSKNEQSSSQNNLLITPRGGQFKLQLPDGTNVWLNASSRFSFPSVFDANIREVSLDGEAYFEVAQNSKSSFIVKTKRGDIRVLGTRFNVSSYQTDPYFTTTLVDGSVQIENRSGHTLLRPGQEAQVDSLAKIQINKVETAYAVAWKDGYFMFNKETIHEVMQKIARWYNVEVHYEGPEPKTKIWGTVSRFDQVGDVLHMLEATGGVKCKIIGRRIIVEG